MRMSMDFEPWGWFQNSYGEEQILGDNQSQNENSEIPIVNVKDEPVPTEDGGDEETNQCRDDDGYMATEPLQNFSNASNNFTIAGIVQTGDDTDSNYNLDDDALFDFGENHAKPLPSEQSQETLVDYEPSVVYICPACGCEFDHQDVWKRHLNQHHDYNTRKGLNFVKVDRLYHECLECHKQIAMHAMENLLKHKFTHLPFRCVKCRICLRQYKYRQDLMVHLRMVHGAELLATARKEQIEKQKQTEQQKTTAPAPTVVPSPPLAIKDVHANAVDLFENSNEGIEVRNEANDYNSEEDAAVKQQNEFDDGGRSSAFIEDSQSRSSSHESGENNDQEKCEQELLELYVHYSCPHCTTEFGSRSEWLQHIDIEHSYTTREGLNFRIYQKQVQCLECKKVLFDTTLANMQQHKFSHMNCSSWLRCKLCFRPFVGQKPIVKHLISQHRLGNGPFQDVPVTHPRPKYRLVPKARDNYEPHIEHLCPQCGQEFADKKKWRKHIIVEHRLTDLQVLRFQVISESHVRCLECDKVITNAYGVQNAQQHAITHMPYKAFVKCRLCAKTYTDRKGLVKHLNSKHRSIIIGVTNVQEWQHKMELKKLRKEQQRQQAILNAAKAKLQAKQKTVTETVYSNGETFIIKFLDEDNGTGDTQQINHYSQNQNDDDDDHLSELPLKKETPKGVPKILNYGNDRPMLQKALQPTLDLKMEPDDDQKSNVSDDLLIAPSTSQRVAGGDDAEDDEEIKPRTLNNELRQTGIEKHFCFLCPACGVVFACQFDWRRHINSVHNFDKRQYLSFRPLDKYRYQCTTCGDVVGNPKLKGLQDHKFRHLPYRLFIKCMICATCYNHKPNMISHLRIRHGIEDVLGNEEQPHIINKSSASPMPVALTAASKLTVALTAAGKLPGLSTVEDCISYHNAVDHESITYHCPQCDMLFETHVYWRKHIVEEHNLNNRDGLNFRQIDAHHFLCLQCYKRVTVTHTKGAIGQLQSHKFRHLPYRSFHCKSCSCEFVRKQMFFKHLDRKTNKCRGNQATIRDEMGVEIAETNAEHSKNNGVVKDDVVMPNTDHTLKSLLNHEILGILCPQCGVEFDLFEKWHQHLTDDHHLDQLENLCFDKLDGGLYACRECGEHMNGWKLSDFQQHKFKHLPYHSYIQCKLCELSFRHLRGMYVHLRVMHPYVVHLTEEQVKLRAFLEYEERPADKEENTLNSSEKPENTDVVAPFDEQSDDQYVLG